MTVGQLKIELEKHSDNMEIFMAERKTEFTFGLLNSVQQRKINFKESPDDEEVLASEMCLILDEE